MFNHFLGNNARYGRCPIQLQGAVREVQLEIRHACEGVHVPDRA